MKSFNYTGFSKKKNNETFHVNSASELIHSHWFFEILKKKNSETFDVNSASELIHSHWFFEIKKKKTVKLLM